MHNHIVNLSSLKLVYKEEEEEFFEDELVLKIGEKNTDIHWDESGCLEFFMSLFVM